MQNKYKGHCYNVTSGSGFHLLKYLISPLAWKDALNFVFYISLTQRKTLPIMEK